MLSNEKLSELFRRTIFAGLEKVDIDQVGQRKSVYEAALNSLDNAHSKNSNLTQDIKNEQRSVLSASIIDIENKIKELISEENSVAEEPRLYLEQDDFPLDDDASKKISIGDFSGKVRGVISKPKIFEKKLLLTILFSLLALVSILAYYANFKQAQNTSIKLPLPYVLNADQALLDFGRTKDKGIIKLANNGEGIIYEVDISEDETVNRLDLVLKGDLGKQILALDEPILVTLHVQKISEENVDLNLLYRGAGRNVRKNIKILDQETNEFFLVTNVDRSVKERSIALIRLQIAPASEKFEENPILLLKKIVFSKI